MTLPLDPSQGAALILFALISPILVAIVKQSGFSKQVNSIIALIVYAVFGLLGALFSGIALTYENLVPLMVTVGLVGRLAYSMFWSQIGGDEEGNGSIDDKITETTSVVKAPA